MNIVLWNTRTRSPEEFMPRKKGFVSMYHCGPTVYDYAHIGNLRAYMFADLVRRMFTYNGFEVKQVMNITDVDDKTIKRSQEEGVALKTLTERFTDYFLKDMDALHILRPAVLPKATEHINEMISLIERLLERGLAYKTEDGSVYYKISAFKNYGALAHLENISLKTGAHSHADEYDKENLQDFALWKAWSDADGEVFWETRLGKGRPGWHIECSAMSMKHLGEEFDIHTGGIDLIFPHHTNEIAQSEGAGYMFVHYWLHNEFIMIAGEKMSKSKGNIITLETVRSKNINPLAYRYWVLTAHYRTLANFTWEALEGAGHALKNLYGQYQALGEEIGTTHDGYKNRFLDFVNTDLEVPQALALLWELLKDSKVSDADKKATVLNFDTVLGLGFQNIEKEVIPEDVLKLVEEREHARAKKDWQSSDELREKIKALGYLVEDTPNGAKTTKI